MTAVLASWLPVGLLPVGRESHEGAGVAQKQRRQACLWVTRACAGDRASQEAKGSPNSEGGVPPREAKFVGVPKAL